MSTESVGARIVREGKANGLSVNDIRMQLAAIYPASAWKGRQTGNYLPWETSVRKQFEDLLKKDPEHNFLARMKYYQEQDLLRSTDQYLLTILDGNYSVYINQTGPFPIAYTIGLNYIFDVPELLIAFTDGQFNNTTFMDLGTLVNAAARRLIADDKSIVENTSATAIFKRFQQDTVFRKVTPTEQKDYMATGTWFYRNFADTEDYPILGLFASVAGEKPEEPLVNTAYERNENVAYFAHKRVDTMPTVDPIDPAQLMMAELIRTRWIVHPKQFSELKEFKITDPEKYSQAAGGCTLEVLKKVIEASPFDVKTFENEAPPIEFAIMNERYDNAKYLISLGAKLSGNGETRTVLMNACQYGVEEGVRVLVEAGAPLDDTDEENWTALSIASKGVLHDDMAKAKRIVEYLWNKGARMM